MRLSPTKTRSRLSLLAVLTAPAALALACGDDVNQYYTSNYYGEGGEAPVATGGKSPTAGSAGRAPVAMAGEAGSAELPTEGGAGGAGAGGGDGIDPNYPDAPLANTTVSKQDLDIFGTIGNSYWFAVSDTQLAAMNQYDGGCCGGGDGLYHPGGSGRANWVDHLWITTAGKHPQTADYGKVQAKIVGQYSRFPWDKNNIPNLNIDADQFVEGQRIAGYEHLRFSNGQRGSIFRDKMAYDLYRMLGYTAPLATYAWVSSNVWGSDVAIPYTLVERYKRTFCERYKEEFGGGCPNMWEFVGDFNYGGIGGPKGGGPIIDGPIGIGGGPAGGGAQPSIFDQPDNCQIDKCETTRVKELEAKLAVTPPGDGFKDALADYIDWPAFHRFQCLSWVLSTTDDTIHAGNNVVLVERADGKFQYLPYSIDISMGFGGGGWGVGLTGQNVLARGCQADKSCWADTLDMCASVVTDLTALDPNKYLKTLYDQLDANGMLRPGDDANFQSINDYFTQRLPAFEGELESYRNGVYCEYPLVDCNGQCVYQGNCYCIPPGKPPIGGEAGAAGAEGGAPSVGPAGDIPVGDGIAAGGNIGVAGTFGVGGDFVAGGTFGVGGDIAVGGKGGGIGGMAGGGPIECPNVKNYAVAR